MKCGGSARARPAPASRGRPLLQEEPRYQLVEGHSGCTFLVLIARRRPVLDSVVVSITYPALVALLPALHHTHCPLHSSQFLSSTSAVSALRRLTSYPSGMTP